MKIDLIWIGKTKESYIKEGMSEYIKRLTKYVSFNTVEVPYIKKKVSIEEQKHLEGEMLLKVLRNYQQVVLLDDKGRLFTSEKFAQKINNDLNNSVKSMAYVIGGAYGFSEAVYKKYPQKMSLSPLTFSHQMIRMVFIEQLYRAYTIMNNEPYHHS